MISDQRVNKFIGDPYSADDEEISGMAEELQQHRAAAHERRWRKISVEGLPEVEGNYQFLCGNFSDNLHNPRHRVLYYKPVMAASDMGWMHRHATHWRPAESDLPESDQ